MNIEACLTSKSDEWETPKALFDELNKLFKFTLDPCATKENAKCKRFFTKEDDGLSKDWSKDVVFMNPPYSELGKWLQKASTASCIALVPARTDTRAWHDHVFGKAEKVVFIKGRLKFGDAKASAPFPSALVFFGVSCWNRDLEKFGKVLLTL